MTLKLNMVERSKDEMMIEQKQSEITTQQVKAMIVLPSCEHYMVVT